MIRPTPITAALAGVFSALAWPFLWSRYGQEASAGGIELILGMLLLVALPAHAFVVGFQRGVPGAGRTVDTALLKRVGAWLAAGIITLLVSSIVRAAP